MKSIKASEMEPKVFTHISDHGFDASQIKGLDSGGDKPYKGGFWASIPTGAAKNGEISEWERFQFSEMPELADCKTVVTFSLSPNARVLYITSHADLVELEKLYPSQRPKDDENEPNIDWEAVQKDYDAIVVDTRETKDTVSAWAVDYSIVVCNPDVIENVQEYEIEEYRAMLINNPPEYIKKIIQEEPCGGSPEEYAEFRRQTLINNRQFGRQDDLSEENMDVPEGYQAVYLACNIDYLHMGATPDVQPGQRFRVYPTPEEAIEHASENSEKTLSQPSQNIPSGTLIYRLIVPKELLERISQESATPQKKAGDYLDGNWSMYCCPRTIESVKLTMEPDMIHDEKTEITVSPNDKGKIDYMPISAELESRIRILHFQQALSRLSQESRQQIDITSQDNINSLKLLFTRDGIVDISRPTYQGTAQIPDVSDKLLGKVLHEIAYPSLSPETQKPFQADARLMSLSYELKSIYASKYIDALYGGNTQEAACADSLSEAIDELIKQHPELSEEAVQHLHKIQKQIPEYFREANIELQQEWEEATGQSYEEQDDIGEHADTETPGDI